MTQKSITTVGASTYETIKRDIIFGRLAPGAKLKLSIMRGQYDASISTLRETLNRLASDGFVKAEEQRGFFVAAVSKEDLVEIANLRVLLENYALGVSIANGDTEWEGDLVKAHHKLATMEGRMLAGDSTAKEMWKRHDWEFHKALIQACDSTNLLSLHGTVFDKYLRYQMLVLTFRGEEAASEHKALLDATLARDVALAQKVLETHILGGLHHSMMAL